MVISFFKNPCNLYFTLWSTYLLQGILYESGSLFSQLVLAVILLISIKNCFEVSRWSHKPIFFRGLTLLLAMYTVYGLIHLMINGEYAPSVTTFHPRTIVYLKTYLVSLLPIYSCYYYAAKKYLTTKTLQLWVILFFFVAVADYFQMRKEALAAFADDREDITNNMGYMFLALLPCMMVYENKPAMQYLGIILCSLFVILAVKRGAMLLTAISIIIFVLYKMRSARGLRKFMTVITVAIGIIVIYSFFEKRLSESQYLNHRIEETLSGDSSGRDELYSDIIKAYTSNTNTLQMLFGRGADGTLMVTKNYAHNDWLETLTNQGILGCVIFALFWFLFYKTIRNKYYSSEARFTLFLIFITLLIKTTFSMSIGGLSIYAASIIGYSLADGFIQQ